MQPSPDAAVTTPTPSTALVAAALSTLGGNTWDGELRVLRVGPAGVATSACVSLPQGATCATWADHPSACVAVGLDSGDVSLYHYSAGGGGDSGPELTHGGTTSCHHTAVLTLTSCCVSGLLTTGHDGRCAADFFVNELL